MKPTAPERDRNSPLSHAQSLIWTGQLLHPGVPLYNMAIAVTIEGTLEVSAFQQAFQDVINASDALRTVFRDQQGVPRCEVKDHLAYETPFYDLRDQDSPQAAARSLCEERARHNFDLGTRLFSGALMRIGPTNYIWFFNHHHLTTDAWSLGVLYDQLNHFYRKRHKATAPPSAKGPLLPYESYLRYLESERGTANRETSCSHWKKKLEDAPSPPALYGQDRQDSSTASIRVSRPLGGPRSEALMKLAQRQDMRALTPQMALFNMFSTLLFAWMSRASNQDRLALGALAHNRTLPEFKQCTGVFVEIFPLFTDVEKEESFVSLYRKVRDEAIGQMQHSQPGASSPALARSFNVILNFITTTLGRFDDAPVEVEWLHSGHGDSGHHLRLLVEDFDDDGELTLHFDFNEHLFSKTQREHAIGHFFRLLDAMTQAPETPISAVDILSPDERRFLLEEWNETTVPIEPDTTLLDLFHRAAREHPDRIALSFPPTSDDETTTRTLSYQELDQDAHRLACRLALAGVRTGNHVALLLEPGPEWITSMLATLKLGAAYVPLSTHDPSEYLTRQIEQAGVAAIVARSQHTDIPLSVPTVLVSEAPVPSTSTQATLAEQQMPGNSDRCYLISTSGSTGQPKFVCGTNAGVINLLSDIERRAPVPEGGASSWWTASTFDVSVYEIWSALGFGRTLHIVPEDHRPDTAKVLQQLQRESVHSAYLPAFMLPELIAQLEQGERRLPQLRRLLVGVEPIQEELLVRLCQLLPELKIVNGYGPAEATICCTLHDVDPHSAASGITPIGKPVQNLNVHLLNESDQLVPVGTPGELCVSGVGLAEGYWNQDQLDDTLFAREENERLYRTGDLARRRPNGDLEFIGRRDHQMKIRGHRIEPGQIVSALQSHPAVRQAVVRPWPLLNPNRIVAYLSLGDQPEKTTNSADLRSCLLATLPPQMVPAQYVILEKLPLNTNGKVDLVALPEPSESSGLESPQETVAPAATAQEEDARHKLAEIWQRAFALKEIALQENFFELGGDSIVAVQIAAQAREVGLVIAARQLFQHQTIASLAAVAEQTSLEDSTDPTEREASSTLSGSQRDKLAKALLKLK